MKCTTAQTLVFALLSLMIVNVRLVRADDDYDMGSPILKEVWVDPVHGLDIPGRGATRAKAYRTVKSAWASIPANVELTNNGFVIMLAPGKYYDPDNVPSELQSVWGTSENPVIFQAADDTSSVDFPAIDITTCRYLYFLGINFAHTSGSFGDYVAKFRKCDHVLLRNCKFLGADSLSSDTATSGIVVYQCPNFYVEKSEVSFIGGSDIIKPSGNAIDVFASQYGHIKQSSIHDFASNGVVLRGGSAYYTIEENTLYYGGGSAVSLSIHDTLSGIDNMVIPWVHYNSYDVKCYNNIIHHTLGAGFYCGGGFNILFAFNTLYQTGLRSSLLYLTQARRGRAVDPDIAQEYLDSGAWGTTYRDLGDDSSSAPIPNKNIFIYNNIFVNTSDSTTLHPHLFISGPYMTPSVNAQCPRPALADENLQIRGNIISNGSPQKQLGLNSSSGCRESNPTCFEVELRTDNLINAAEQTFVGADFGNFRPEKGSTVFTIGKAVKIPNFDWTSIPTSDHIEPAGNDTNAIPMDLDSNKRKIDQPIAGAYVISTSSVAGEAIQNLELKCFPNPTNDEAFTLFHLNERSRVSVELFNSLGEKIEGGFISTLDAGDHEFTFHLKTQESGIYFCRISTPGIVQTKRIILIH
ncbi:MAG: right-handed parallel beta-helix repeat-containing protein [bacterium]